MPGRAIMADEILADKPYFYPNAGSLKAVKDLIKTIEITAGDSSATTCSGIMTARFEAALADIAAGGEPSYAKFASEQPAVDYLTEKVPAVIVCLALVVGGAIAGFLWQAILIAAFLSAGIHFTIGVDSEHMVSEGNRLLNELDDSISSIDRTLESRKTKGTHRDFLKTLRLMAIGARNELASDLEVRTRQ